MPTYTYPTNDLDNADTLLGLLGSYWSTTYLGMDFLQDVLQSKAHLTAQTWLNFMELIASVSRFDVPIFHQENWYPLVLKESELNNFDLLIPDYKTGTSYTYDVSAGLEYGKAAEIDGYFSVPLPPSVTSAKTILNHIVSPSVVFTEGVDYWIEKSGVLTFSENPFNNSSMTIRDVRENSAVVDKECVLWLYHGQWDWDTIYEQFGYVLNLHMASSEGYRDIVNAVLDAFTGGTSSKDIQFAWSAITGIPLVVGQEETVEIVEKDSRSLAVVTDKNAYSFPLNSTAVVSAGDKVHAGDELVDAVQIFEFNRGGIPADLTGLVLGPGLLSLGFFGELAFENKDAVIVVEENVEGYTKVSWDLGGFPGDVAKFWEDTHAAGIATGKTLAMYLDIRPNPVDQPSAINLPSTINSLEFLCENFLRYNTFLVKIKSNQLGADKFPSIPAESLRKIIPPQTAMIVLVELVHTDNPVIMDGAGSASDAGYEEELSGFPCMPTSESMVGTTYITEETRLVQITGRCQ
tara:strand:- start:2610 stop:4166 length:1557 start_codon:yes stop_codon:yes gene_type:complete